MPITLLQIILLGLIQGAAELLPVSSSAHVIVAEKLMGINPTSPEMTFLLVMLHTGTMFAVILYFWRAWRENFFSSGAQATSTAKAVVLATAVTGIVGFGLKWVIEHKLLAEGGRKGAVEDLFGRLPLIASALAVVGVLILIAARRTQGGSRPTFVDVAPRVASETLTRSATIWIGLVQALCLPIRGLSRSGATISTGLLAGVGRRRSEEFSFALGVVLTPPVIVLELHRLLQAHVEASQARHLAHLLLPGLIGMLCSFLTGLVALRLLSRWLEAGRWAYFGYYCLFAAAVVGTLAAAGI